MSEPATDPRRARRLLMRARWALAIGGVSGCLFLFMQGLAVLSLFSARPTGASGIRVVLALGAIPAIVGRGWLLRARQLSAGSPVSRLTTGMHFYALYLRAFRAEGKEPQDVDAWALVGAGWMSVGKPSFEDELARRLASYARLVAIGNPQEKRPQVGALRLYVADECWQECTRRLVADARVVILRPARSPGVMHEQELCLRAIPSKRMVVCNIGRGWKRAYRKFREEALRIRGIAYPELATRFMVLGPGGTFYALQSARSLAKHLQATKRWRDGPEAE